MLFRMEQVQFMSELFIPHAIPISDISATEKLCIIGLDTHVLIIH